MRKLTSHKTMIHIKKVGGDGIAYEEEYEAEPHATVDVNVSDETDGKGRPVKYHVWLKKDGMWQLGPSLEFAHVKKLPHNFPTPETGEVPGLTDAALLAVLMDRLSFAGIEMRHATALERLMAKLKEKSK